MLVKTVGRTLGATIASSRNQLFLQSLSSQARQKRGRSTAAPIHRPTLLQTRTLTSTMATSQSPPFTKSVCAAMESLYPLALADTRWDNVGLLLDNTHTPTTPPSKTILLTTDLTPDVAREAIAHSASVIITYHPLIFTGLKSITHSSPQQSILLDLMRHNIAVYSPHTAVDASPNGVNTWLANVVASENPGSRMDVVVPNERVLDAGYGRLVTLGKVRSVAQIVGYLREGLKVERVSIAAPVELRGRGVREVLDKVTVSRVAVCAGSGWDVLKGTVEKEVGDGGAEVLVMGEASHHNALAATMKGRWVVTVFHSNSERGYLPKMQEKLAEKLGGSDKGVQVLVSQHDRDPFEII